MIRTIIALTLAVAVAGGAAASSAPAPTTPRLKELVTVRSEIVRIGDLVEHAGATADIAVFRAPDLGQTGTVAVSRIAEALRPHKITGLDTRGLTEVVVTRLSRAIAAQEVSERIARAFAGQFGFGDTKNLSVILDRGVRALHVEASATGELAVARMRLEPRSGRFDVTLELPGSAAARHLPLRFTGTVTETVQTATLARSVRSGEIIRASDILMERRRKAEVGGEALGAEQAIGLAAKRPLRGGQAVRPADLMKPQVVQRNETVTILYQVPGVTLTVRGKALEAGSVGDIIGVLNVQSNRPIQGTVVGPGRVTMTAIATAPRVAAAVADARNDPERPRTQ
jgi:flagella basal body P-ring formation protein FlgA